MTAGIMAIEREASFFAERHNKLNLQYIGPGSACGLRSSSGCVDEPFSAEALRADSALQRSSAEGSCEKSDLTM